MKKKILIIAAHPDDETIGCGGTIARHAYNGDEVGIITLTDGVNSRNNFNDEDVERRSKAAKSGSLFLPSSGRLTTASKSDLIENEKSTPPLAHPSCRPCRSLLIAFSRYCA